MGDLLSMRRRPRGGRGATRAPGVPSPSAAAPAPGALGPPRPLIPRLSHAALQAVLRESERPLRQWLDANIDQVRALSARASAAELIRRVPEARTQGAAYAEGVVRAWAAERGLTLRRLSIIPHQADALPTPAAGTSLADSAIVSAVSRAIGIVTDGVVVERAHGRFQINASGATTELRGGRLRVGGGVGWSGEMSLASRVGAVHFNASVSSERWTVRLSFPGGSMPVDLSALQGIFTAAGEALPAVAREASAMESLSDAPTVIEGLSEELGAIRRAVSTASAIARTRPGVSFGIEAGGPGPSGPATGAPQATSIRGVLTIVF
jgi:hypothetical protein